MNGARITRRVCVAEMAGRGLNRIPAVQGSDTRMLNRIPPAGFIKEHQLNQYYLIERKYGFITAAAKPIKFAVLLWKGCTAYRFIICANTAIKRGHIVSPGVHYSLFDIRYYLDSQNIE